MHASVGMRVRARLHGHCLPSHAEQWHERMRVCSAVMMLMCSATMCCDAVYLRRCRALLAAAHVLMQCVALTQ